MRASRTALRALLVGAALYAGVCIVARLMYRRALYPAPHRAPVATPLGAKLLSATASDGAPVHALDFTRPSDRGTVVFFHGNGELADDAIPFAETLRRRGLGAVLVEYRGYGASAGAPAPTEEGLYADAEAVLAALARREGGGGPLVLVGYSLGSGVAAEMAARGHGKGLVLLAPFTSLPDLSSRRWPMLPMSIIPPDRFETLAKAPRIAVPSCVLHGDRDDVVPFDMGEAVAKALPNARFVRVEGASHVDLFAKAEGAIVDAVIELAR
jgi:pimeloyl-ACP methyl ester carboxylesterase